MKENKVLADRVLIEPMIENQTASGILISDKERPMKGKVVLVGPGTKDITMTVKLDDTVLHGKYSGIEIKLKGKTYLLMKQDDVLMVTNN